MQHASVDLGNDPAMQFYVIQTGLFSGTIPFWHYMVSLNNFAYLSKCPWVQGKSNEPPPTPEVCVCVGGGTNSYSMILPQSLVH